MLNRYRSFSLPGTLLLCAVLLSACNETITAKPEAPAPIVQGNTLRFVAGHPQLALLNLSNAEPAKSIAIELPSKLVWNEEHTQRIYPAFAGRVIAIKADIGQSVTSGTLLAQLASPEFGMAQSDTAKAQADVRLTQKALQRQRELFEAGIVARKELEQTETDAERAQAELDRAQARTRMYGSTSAVDQQLGLTASIGGVVVERNLNPGQEVRPDQAGPGVPALFVVTDPSSLWVQIDARESEIGMVRNGAKFDLSIPSLAGQKFEARVVAASDFIDPMTRTIKIRAIVSNPKRILKAEMLATAHFELKFNDGVVVPATAVLLNGTRHTVFVQSRTGEFEPRTVEIAFEGSKLVVIASGLQSGEQVVSENVLLLARQFQLAQEEAKTPGKSNSEINTAAVTGKSAESGISAK